MEPEDRLVGRVYVAVRLPEPFPDGGAARVTLHAKTKKLTLLVHNGTYTSTVALEPFGTWSTELLQAAGAVHAQSKVAFCLEAVELQHPGPGVLRLG
ncbi:hypothetical protein HaLaN_30893, partial [Haematococcus lacustris]